MTTTTVSYPLTRATAGDGSYLTDSQIDYLGDLVDSIDSLSELVARLTLVATAGHLHGGAALEAARELNRVDVRMLADIVAGAAVAL